jgi:hypothetical protein
MNKVTLDRASRLQLDNPDAEVEVCDQTGRTVGYYLPAGLRDELLYAWAKSQVSEQELELARQQPGGRSLKDILADLNNRCDTR